VKIHAHSFGLAAVLLLLVSGCAGPSSPAYALAYRQALEDFPGVEPIDPTWLDRFVTHFSSRGDEPLSVDSDALYAEQLYFCDTLLTTRSRAQLREHMEAFTGSGARVDIEVLDQQIDGSDAYLVWFMRARFAPAGREVSSQTLGISHLRFNAAGQIVLHQDFWDAAAGFYEHVPILGGAIRRIGRRFDPPDAASATDFTEDD